MQNRIERNDLKGLCSLKELKQIEKEELEELKYDLMYFEVTEYSSTDDNIINKEYFEAYKVKNNFDSAYELYTLKYAKENEPIVSIKLGYIIVIDLEKMENNKFRSYEVYHYGKYSEESKVEIISSEGTQFIEKM